MAYVSSIHLVGETQIPILIASSRKDDPNNGNFEEKIKNNFLSSTKSVLSIFVMEKINADLSGGNDAHLLQKLSNSLDAFH